MWFFVYFCRLYGSYVRCVMYRFYTVCVSFILFACPGFCTLSASRDDAAGPGDLLRFFAASFVRSYPGDWPAFSRAGNFGFSARFYRRPGPAFLA
jgi:hypothetical protein